jgi:hypothetical protein
MADLGLEATDLLSNHHSVGFSGLRHPENRVRFVANKIANRALDGVSSGRSGLTMCGLKREHQRTNLMEPAPQLQ